MLSQIYTQSLVHPHPTCRPVRVVPDPIRGAPHVLVMCEVFSPDGEHKLLCSFLSQSLSVDTLSVRDGKGMCIRCCSGLSYSASRRRVL